MASQLSPEDLEFVETIINAGVLQDIKDHLIDQSKGVVLITCSDGDRFDNIYKHQVRLQAPQRKDPRIHPFSWHGGALTCVPCSPVNKGKHDHEFCLRQISEARIFKGLEVAIALAHAPCTAVEKSKLTIQQSIALQVRAKGKIKNLNPGIKCPLFFHVDYGDKMRTYFLSAERWEQWAPRHQKAMMAVA